MMTEILRRYQRYNRETGEFDQDRSLRSYAQLLGVNVSTLSLLFSGIQASPSLATMQALARLFPAAAAEVAAALTAQPAEAVA